MRHSLHGLLHVDAKARNLHVWMFGIKSPTSRTVYIETNLKTDENCSFAGHQESQTEDASVTIPTSVSWAEHGGLGCR